MILSKGTFILKMDSTKFFSKLTPKTKNCLPLNSKGFTLVEVLIAVTILATIAVIVSSSWGGNVVRLKSSKVKVNAVELLQRKIIEIEAEYTGNADSLPSEKQTGTFEDERFKNYSWQWESQEINIPDISALVETDGQDTLVVAVLDNFRTYLNQSIKEVLVTVEYKQGKEKPYKFSVPFYIVNFDNQISLGIAGADGGSALPTGNQGSGSGTPGGR